MDLYKLFLLEAIVVLRMKVAWRNRCNAIHAPLVNMYFSYFGGRVVMQKALCMVLLFSSAIW